MLRMDFSTLFSAFVNVVRQSFVFNKLLHMHCTRVRDTRNMINVFIKAYLQDAKALKMFKCLQRNLFK